MWELRRVQTANSRGLSSTGVAIAARHHTLFAALSLGIPSLAIGWHHKYEGLLSLVEQEHFVCDFQNLTEAGLYEAFAQL